MRNVKIAAVQMSMTSSVNENISKAEALVRKAASEGANIILLPELFENLYFCQERNYDYYQLASELNDNPAVKRFRTVAKELGVVLPISFYEKDVNSIYNSAAVIDADGTILGIFRMIISIRKNSILLPEILDLRSGKQNSAGSVWGSAGINGFPKPHAAWR